MCELFNSNKVTLSALAGLVGLKMRIELQLG